MIPALIGFGAAMAHHKLNKERYGNNPSNDMYDEDLDRLSQSCTKALLKLEEDEEDDKALQIKLRQNIELQNIKDEGEDWFIEHGILVADRIVWCDGHPLEPGNPDDYKLFMEIKNQAYLRDTYNDIPLDDGGGDALYIDWFRIQGFSKYGAQKMMELGINPWEVDEDDIPITR